MRASIRAFAAVCKEKEKKEKGKEGASSSAPKFVENGVLKREANGKDDHPFKKASVTPEEKQPKKPSSPKLSHEIGKGLMTASGTITQRTRCLLTHKGYAIEMVESIIRETDVAPCAE